MKPDIHKFKTVELFTDSKGRTSPGKVVGFFACVVSILIFFAAGIVMIALITGESKDSDAAAGLLTQNAMMQAVAFFALGGGLLGIRRFTKDKEIVQEQLTNSERQEFPIQ